MNKDNETREIFDILNQERAERVRYESGIVAAAERAAVDVDFETIGMFRRAGIPLPARLQKLADMAWGTA
jgi:hypothetical protein